MTISKKFRAAYKALLFEAFFLIAFGGLVREMDAGLACPDWPLCFGHFIPSFHPQVYFEFIHRVFAGSITILVLWLHYLIWRNPTIPKKVKWMALISVVLLAAQVVLGGLTVLDLLKAGIVTMHLGFGTAFFISMLWIYFHLQEESKPFVSARPLWFRAWAFFLPLVVFGQILLGGWVASNYAGLACGNEFPLCYGRWIPTLSGTIGIQVIHRLGAYFTALVIFVTFVITGMTSKREWMDRRIVIWSRYLLALVLLQIIIGVTNIKTGIPASVADLHLMVAETLLAVAVRILYLTQSPDRNSL